nr:unnamed protein product [Digitaria exilis]
MNVFRLAGDMTHLLSVVVLLLKIHTIKSCAGNALFLSLPVSTESRWHFSPVRNGLLGARPVHGGTGREISISWESRRLSTVVVCLVMWAFSIYLEAVAIFPQLVLLQRTRNIDNLTGQYVFFLGAYRVLYILNWIYRYFTEPHFVHWISWVAGLVQTLLYADFFYYYIMSWKNNVKLELPA